MVWFCRVVRFARMKKILSSTIVLVGAGHFAVWSLCLGFLWMTGFHFPTLASMLFGVAPEHSLLRDVQEWVFVAWGMLFFPLSLLGFWSSNPIVGGFLGLANSSIWGVCLGALIVGLRRWARRMKARGMNCFGGQGENPHSG
jgi:hypothetical protein